MSKTKNQPPTQIQLLLDQWRENGKELPPPKERQQLKKSYLRARKELESVKEQAAKLVEEAERSLSRAASKCVAAFGNTPLQIEGELYDPLSRGEVVYYRRRPQRKKELEVI